MEKLTQLTAELLDLLRTVDTCTVSNAIETFGVRMRNEGYMQHPVRCLFPELGPVAGYAVTGRIRTGAPPVSNLCYYQRPDWWEYVARFPSPHAPKILVLADVDYAPGAGAFVGEIHAEIGRALGCVGYVTNGVVRDIPALRRNGFQCFAAGVCVSHGYGHIVDFGEPVEIGSLKVSPGDVLQGDLHGVLSIPREIAAARLADEVRAIQEREAELIGLCRAADFSIEKLTAMLGEGRVMSATKSSLNLSQNSSYRQTRVFLFVGFGGLLLLMTVLGASAVSSMYQVELREKNIRQEYLVRNRALEHLRSNTYVSGTCIRDFLLAASDRLADVSKAQFLDKQRQIVAGLIEYRKLLTADSQEPFARFSEALHGWFGAMGPVLEWDASTRRLKGYAFMQEQVLPGRSLVLDSADRLQQLAEQDLELRSDEVSAMVSNLRTRLMVLIALTVLAGMALAGVALWRLLRLESESMLRFQEVLGTREELKRLSAEVLSAQETERRRISRELHDEVGQVLSAIALGIGNARSALRDDNHEEVDRQLEQLLKMIESNIGVVRNIALLLRPTMLDDLGLVPALRWLAKEFSRTTETHIDLVADSFLDDLPEEHRTCIFRVVQEAVRNAARHSGARLIRIYLQQEGAGIRAAVHDDGKGFDAGREKGLGMIGMEERVAHLGGRLRVDSEAGRGTVVSFELPRPGELNGHAQISPFRTA